MKILNMTSAYIDAVVDIEKICFNHPWSRDNISSQLSNDLSHFIVADNGNGDIMGYMGVQIICGEGYVTNIAVLPQFRRQGVAKALIKKALDNEMNFLSLEVRRSNVPALNLYESMGFRKVGLRRGFYTEPKEDAVIMTYYKHEIGDSQG